MYKYSSPETLNLAQAFTNGAEPGRYVLSALRFGLSTNASQTALSWTLHADNGDEPASTPLFERTDVPASILDTNHQTFEERAHPGFLLAPNTKYWAVLTGSRVMETSTLSTTLAL